MTYHTDRETPWLAVALVWAALVVSGFVLLGSEAYRAAPHVIMRPWYPVLSPLPLAANRATLLVFVHPQCPCTQATFENLEQLRTKTENKLAVAIIFTLPPGVPPGWEKGSLFSAANRMPGVRVFRDVDGTETRRFGVMTSGHVLMYAPNGHLLFSGGITAGRGHAGDSPGESAIVHLTKEPFRSDTVEKPVFGCTLL
jgi:hypothetical protein